MKTILVPTDFSECSNTALPYAALIAKKTGAQILFLHILFADPSLKKNFLFRKELIESAKVKMKQLLSDPVLEEIDKADIIIKTGSISQRVIEMSEKHNVNMIIMGTHGSSGWHEFLIGSNAEKIVRDADVPVLSVKEYHNNPKLETIVFASDFLNEWKTVFPTIKGMAKILDAKLNLVKVFAAVEPATALKKKPQASGFRKWTIASENDVFICHNDSKEEGIMHYANSVHADIIAVGTHGRRGLPHLVIGSLAEKLTNHCSLPVLTIKFHQESVPDFNDKTIKQTQQDENSYMYSIPVI